MAFIFSFLATILFGILSFIFIIVFIVLLAGRKRAKVVGIFTALFVLLTIISIFIAVQTGPNLDLEQNIMTWEIFGEYIEIDLDGDIEQQLDDFNRQLEQRQNELENNRNSDDE